MTDPLARLSAALAGRYTVERELGQGGMATVYLAHDVKHDRQVAIKVLNPELAAVLGVERFLAEIKVTANLRHPNLLPLFDSGEVLVEHSERSEGPRSFLYYVMPYIEGPTLRVRLDAASQLPVDEVVRLIGVLANALDYAHAQNIVHRDLKPENILLQSGQPVIADFGIALAVAEAGGERVTQTGLSLGTPLYMSPEQATGERSVDARADQYALGAIAYEMLTGEPPHTGATARVIISRLMTETPRPIRSARPEVPAGVDTAVQRALAKAPADRWAGCGEFARALAAREERIPPPPETVADRNRGWLGFIAAGIAVVAIVTAVIFWRPARSSAPPAGNASVAVLPFSDLSPDRTNEYFGDGIAETLISALGNVPGLDVAARTSAFSFRGKNVDVREIGTSLGVSTVLEGSVQRAGDKLRITAQLVKAADGVSLWSETFDRSTTDIFAVQDEVARAVIAALRGRVLAGTVHGEAAATRDPEAYDLYLQGRFYQAKRTTVDVERAIGLFQQALARDSLFVQAWTGLADAYIVLAFYSNVPSVATLAQARTAADRALAIDPDFGAAVTSRAYLLLLQDWDLPKADSAFRRAIQLSPGYVNAHKWYADVLNAAGQRDQALASFTRALQLDPLSAITNANLGGIFLARGDTVQALARTQKALALDPTLPLALRTIARMYFARGDTAAFFAAQERLEANSTRAGASADVLRRAWQSGGHDAVCRQQIEAFTAGKLWFERADWRAELGDFDGAFHDLDLAVKERSILLPLVRSQILNPAFQRDPRFGALLRRVGLQGGG